MSYMRRTPDPVIVTIRDNKPYQGPFIFLVYHFYSAGDPPNVSSTSSPKLEFPFLFPLSL